MKKLLVFMVMILAFIAISGQTITINSIGMHGVNGTGDYDVSDNETLTLKVNYTSTGLSRSNQLSAYSFAGNDGQISLSFYTSITPNGNDRTGQIFYSVPFNPKGRNGTFDIIETFNVGSIPLTATSIQANLSLRTTGGYYSLEYSSYQLDALYGTVVPTSSPGTGYQNYLTVFNDVATLAPTLYTPNSHDVATYDNKTLLIDFKLNETPLANSVKLYFSPNSDGSSPSTTLTLANTYENTTRHQIEFNATLFSSASPLIDAVTGATSLTHLNTYYVAIGYQDALGNSEAKSPWHKLIYDNAAIKPTLVAGSSSTGSNFNVNFTLGEASQTNGVTIYIKNTSNVILSTLAMSGNYSPGSNIITLNGTNLGNSPNVLNVSGLISLDFGNTYLLAVKMLDLAENSITSDNSASFQYLNHDLVATAIAYTVSNNSPLLGYNFGAYQAVGCVGIKTDSGTITLSSMAFEVGGTIEAVDAANLALYESSNNSFALATQISSVTPFTGTGTYTFAIANSLLSTSEKYYFLAISLNESSLTSDDYISLSTSNSDIITSGNLNIFTAPDFAQKYLFKAIVVDFFADFPSITPGTPNAPFFRLDLIANSGTSTVTALELCLSGTIISNDVMVEGFKVWESSSSTFDPSKAKATQIGNSADFNHTLSFSGFTSNVSADPKYYFFTVSTKATANTEATIGGDILSASSITTSAGTTVCADLSLPGFPLVGEQQTLPVELSAFTAVVTSQDFINISWTVESETNLSGYNVLRSEIEDANLAVRVNKELVAANNVNTSITYSYTDCETEINTTYYYWLESNELNGSTEMFGPIKIKIGEENIVPEIVIPTKSGLITIYPNPFNPSTTLSFSVVSPGPVTLDIYNIRGQLVKHLYNNNVPANMINQRIALLWNGRDNNNKEVASGLYYAKLQAGKHNEFKKMVLMK